MSTCFLFIEHLTDSTCLTLLLDSHKKMIAPLARRTFDDIKQLQSTAKTIVVLPCERCAIHYVQLPWVSIQKARAALPYALEEQLAQPVTSVHIAFDQQHYQNKQYLVIVIDKAYLQGLIERLHAVAIGFDCITLDWFALKPLECCISETCVLAFDETFQGALSTELAAMYFARRQNQTPILMFDDSAQAMKSTAFELIDGSFYEWVAWRLLDATPINLCQGDFQLSTTKQRSVRWYQACLALAFMSVSIFFITYGITYYQLSNKNKQIDHDISIRYQEFFPNASAVISPKFRVTQLLKSEQGNLDETLWILLDKLAVAMGQQALTIEQLNYDNLMLSITLSVPDFSALEALQFRLQQAHVQVTQVQASLHEKQALATLELRL